VPALFVFVILEIGSHFMPRLTWFMILPFVLPCIARITGVCHHAQSLVEMGSCELFAQAGFQQ
jgi:hypothetical protein